VAAGKLHKEDNDFVETTRVLSGNGFEMSGGSKQNPAQWVASHWGSWRKKYV